jgi:CelD/BcsL family acetyltransferase involved in cellulose biosynthesis
VTVAVSARQISDLPDSIIEEWDGLATSSPAGIFAAPAWHRAMEHGLAAEARPGVVVEVREGLRLLGLGAFRLGRRLLFRDITFASMAARGYGVADYGGLVSLPDCEGLVTEAILDWLRSSPTWDVLDLQQIPGGPGLAALVEGLPRMGFSALIWRQSVCHRVRLPDTWHEYRATLSANTREWLERKPRKVERELGAKVEQVPAQEVVAEYLRMRQMQEKRFGERFPSRSDRRMRDLMLAWLPLADRLGYLRMLRLQVSGRTIGVLLGFSYSDTYYYYSSGFESAPEFGRYSLGACLLAGALRQGIEQRLDWFDLLRGDYAYKKRFRTEAKPNYRIMAFRSALRSRAMQLALRLRGRRVTPISSSDGSGTGALPLGAPPRG